MVDFYLNEISYKPEYIMLVVYKDDFNPNSLAAQTSETYLELMTWRKYKPNYSWLRSVRGSLYNKFSNLWQGCFLRRKTCHPGKKNIN